MKSLPLCSVALQGLVLLIISRKRPLIIRSPTLDKCIGGGAYVQVWGRMYPYPMYVQVWHSYQHAKYRRSACFKNTSLLKCSCKLKFNLPEANYVHLYVTHQYVLYRAFFGVQRYEVIMTSDMSDLSRHEVCSRRHQSRRDHGTLQ